jgi:hypothetical protein
MPVQAATPAPFTLMTPGSVRSDSKPGFYGQRGAQCGRARVCGGIDCTGGGVTSPEVVDGAITGTPLPELTQTVAGYRRRDSGQGCCIKGGAPTAVGLTQINAEIQRAFFRLPQCRSG